jgi:hypothetical protein
MLPGSDGVEAAAAVALLARPDGSGALQRFVIVFLRRGAWTRL